MSNRDYFDKIFLAIAWFNFLSGISTFVGLGYIMNKVPKEDMLLLLGSYWWFWALGFACIVFGKLGIAEYKSPRQKWKRF